MAAAQLSSCNPVSHIPSRREPQGRGTNILPAAFTLLLAYEGDAKRRRWNGTGASSVPAALWGMTATILLIGFHAGVQTLRSPDHRADRSALRPQAGGWGLQARSWRLMSGKATGSSEPGVREEEYSLRLSRSTSAFEIARGSR
jgi:hypothetical protein